MCRIIVVLLLAASFADHIGQCSIAIDSIKRRRLLDVSSMTLLCLLFLLLLRNRRRPAIEGWSKINNTNSGDDQGWYKYHFIPETWTNARLRCQREGGILASPINSHLLELMRTVLTTGRHSASAFTGISATYSGGEFYSVEGVSIENIEIDWLYGEPVYNKDSDRCIAMNRDGQHASTIVVQCGQLIVVDCHERHPYFCYTTRDPDSKENECGIVPGYKFDPETKHCYKFHESKVAWSEAFRTCSAEGGYLTIINSDAEAQMLKKLYRERYFSLYAVWAGGSDWDKNGLWMTIHGQTLEEAGYADWDNGQPTADELYCLALNNRNYKLTNYNCNQSIPAFICEKNTQ